MDSTKRYYTLREAAQLLGIPLHQARRWVKQFLSSPREGRLRLSSKELEQLRLVYQGFYAYRLRGQALRDFIRAAPASALRPEPYALLREIHQRLLILEGRLSHLSTPPVPDSAHGV